MDQASEETFRDLSARIVDLCGRIHGAEFQLLELIRRLDDMKPWTGSMPSCAHWLVWRCGMDIVTAREKVRVAHALAELPQLCEKFRSGDLSYSKVRALTRIAESSNENEWVETALEHTAAELERIIRRRRQTACLEAPDAALQAWKHRHFDYHVEADGSLVFEGRLPAEVGAMVVQAMDRAMEWMDEQIEVPRDAEIMPEGDSAESNHVCGCGEGVNRDASAEASLTKPTGDHPSISARRADALGVLAERFLAVAPEGDDSLQTSDRFLLTVHASVASLPLRARVDPSDPPVLEHGPVLATETVRRIGCDAALLRIIESGAGEPLDVGRKTRVIPPAIRRALKRRDGGCRFPGCTHTTFVDGHHIVHWADGGVTSLDNLVSVCRHHHRLLHEGGHAVVKNGAEFVFLDRNGRPVPRVSDRLRPGQLDTTFGQDVTTLGSATDRLYSRQLASAGLPWRVAGSRGFGRSSRWSSSGRSKSRAAWNDFAAASGRG